MNFVSKESLVTHAAICPKWLCPSSVTCPHPNLFVIYTCFLHDREHIERQRLQDKLESWSESQDGPEEGGGAEEPSWSNPILLKPTAATEAPTLQAPETMDDLLSSEVHALPSTLAPQSQPCALAAQHSLQTPARPHLVKANRRAHSSHVLLMAHEWEQPRAADCKEGVVFMQLSER